MRTMKKTILEVYAMAVCFFTAVCFVVTAAMGLYALLGMSKPEFTMSSMLYEDFQSNDAYFESYRGYRMARECSSDEKKDCIRPPEARLTQLRTDAYARAVATEGRNSTQMLVKCLIVMLVDVLMFAVHWVLARRSRARAEI